MRTHWLSGSLCLALAACGGPEDDDDILLPPAPAPLCTAPVEPADVSAPSAVVGDGSPASCTEEALRAALAGGGVIVFDCGPDPVTIPIVAELEVNADTVLDGGGVVTLDGQDSTRILAMRSSFEQETPRLTIQNLGFANGRTDDVPNTSEVDQGGAAIFKLGGSLTILNSTFANNHGPTTGQDVAGGAVFSLGGGPTIIVGSVFAGNTCSNGGAIGNLGAALVLVNSTLSQNAATGTDGNPGNGGNGGGASVDGAVSIDICGASFLENEGNAFGGGIFRVGPNGDEPTTIDRSVFDGNRLPDSFGSLGGGVYLQSTVITMREVSITRNESRAGGGFFVGPGAQLTLSNSTIAENTALSSLGGGLAIDGSATGEVVNATIAGNRAPGKVAFAAGISGGGAGITLRNTLLMNPEVGNGFNPINCTARFTDGGGNLQFPVVRAGGGSDDPDSLCVAAPLIADPLLLPLVEELAEGRIVVPLAKGSPAAGIGQNCPATDQRGEARPAACTAGAVEAP